MRAPFGVRLDAVGRRPVAREMAAWTWPSSPCPDARDPARARARIRASGGHRDLRADGVRQDARSRRRSRTRSAPRSCRRTRCRSTAGLPILTNQPARPTRLVGDPRRSTTEVSVGEYAALAHAAIDELVAATGQRRRRRRHGPLPPRRARRARPFRPRPRPACASAGSAAYDDARRRRSPRAARRASTRRPPRVVHPNDRRRVVRALELAETGASLVAGREPALDASDTRHPTLAHRARRARRTSSRGGSSERTREMFAAVGSAGGAARRSRAPSRRPPRQVLGLAARSPSCSPRRRRERIVAAHATLRRLPAEVDAADPGHRHDRRRLGLAGRRSPMRFAKWHALGNAYLLVERADARAPSRAETRSRGSATPHSGIGSDGVLEIVDARRRPRPRSSIWNPDGSRRRDVRERHPHRGVLARRRSGSPARGRVASAAATCTRACVRRVDVGDRPRRGRRRAAGRARRRRRATRGHAGLGREPACGRPARPGARGAPPPRPARRDAPALPRVARTSSSSAPVEPERPRACSSGSAGRGRRSPRARAPPRRPLPPSTHGWCESPVHVHLPGGDADGRHPRGPRDPRAGRRVEICRGETV